LSPPTFIFKLILGSILYRRWLCVNDFCEKTTKLYHAASSVLPVDCTVSRSRLIYWQSFPAFFAFHATGSLVLVFAAEDGIYATLPFALFDDIV